MKKLVLGIMLISLNSCDLFKSGINFEIDNPVLLTIDVSEYKHKNKFYIDPNLKEGGVYTIGNIPPSLIINYTKM